MTKPEIRRVQADLNRFVKRSGLGLAPLRVDGDKGFLTRRLIREVKFLLGFGKKRINANLTDEFLWQLKHPHRAKPVDPEFRRRHPARARGILKRRRVRVRRGLKRRTARRRDVARQAIKAIFTSGVTFYDGKPCAKWMIPYLDYARAHGWRGVLVSGWRDPLFSEKLCLRMCGRPSCPGKCAGRASNHVGNRLPRGALDVSDFIKFGDIMRGAKLGSSAPRIFNALGPRDPVHYSASGR